MRAIFPPAMKSRKVHDSFGRLKNHGQQQTFPKKLTQCWDDFPGIVLDSKDRLKLTVFALVAEGHLIRFDRSAF